MRIRKPYRVRRKKAIFANRFFWLSLFILIFIGAIFYFLIFSSYFQIKEIKISGNQKLKTEDLKNFIEKRINRKIISFTNRSIFLINPKEIEKNISENFPLISKANLKRKFPNSLILNIEERQPIFIWCQNSQSCFYLDKEGIIFEEVFDSALIKIKNQGEGKLGKKIIEKEIVDFCQKAQLKLRELGLFVKEFLISEDKITAQLEQDWQVYFNSKEDPEKQILKLSLVLENEIPQEKKGSLEYIDLRFGNRVYYKYKEKSASY